MLNQTLHLDKTGGYLFRGPTRVNLTANRELVVVIAVPSHKACGIVLFSPDEDFKRLEDSLDTVYQKIADAYGVSSPDLQAKIFGLRTGTLSILEAAQNWLKQNGIRITAQDTGANASRKLVVDCSSGKIGVSYSESTPVGERHWLSEGTVRGRNPLETIQAEVLVITKNPVKKALAKQSVEEERYCSCSTPKDVDKFLSQVKTDSFPWSVVLLFDDLEESKALAFVERVKDLYPAVEFRWVGLVVPIAIKRAFPEIKHLPPIEPALIPEFKRKLQTAIVDHFTNGTSELLPFKKVQKK